MVTPTKIWVISLADAQSRRERFTADNRAEGIEWSFFDAHRSVSNDLDYDEPRCRQQLLRPLRPGELGCYSSHVSLWEWLVNSEFEQMIVLEDDVVLDWEFAKMLLDVDFSDLGIEYLRLFAKVPGHWRPVAAPFVEKYRYLIRYTSPVLGTQGYVLTRTGAARFLTRVRDVVAPIDFYMDRTDWHGVLNLAVFPFPLYERCQPSSIGELRFQPRTGHGLNGLVRRLSRRLAIWRAVYGPNPPAAVQLREKIAKHEFKP